MPFSGTDLNENQVVCPHCWHQFYEDQSLYIAGHPDLYGDPVLGDLEKTRFAPSAVEIDRTGVAHDPRGGRMTERACPVCHLQIPPELLKQRGRIMSLVGAPSAGKTYFLTSMLHHLRSELTRNFGFALRDSDSHEVKMFLEYESTLFGSSQPDKLTLLKKTWEAGELYNRVRLQNATSEISLPKPFIFSLTPTLSNPEYAKRSSAVYPVVMYDNAGESFDFLKENDSTSRVTQHLGKCDAVMFAFDPTLDTQTTSRLQSVSDDPQVNGASHFYRQESILTEVVNRMRRQRNLAANTSIPAPLLVCVQKYDVWKSLVPYATSIRADGSIKENIDHTSVEFFREHGIAGLDIEEINRVSLLVRCFLQDVNPSFVELAESQFASVRYFPVSALGTSPEVDPAAKPTANPREFLKVRPSRIQPFRVTHPFLWLMLQWKLIRPVKRRSPPRDIPQAQVESFSGRLRTKLPVSGGVLVLDQEYAGTQIIDPYCGEPVWIPNVKLAVATPSNPTPVATPTASPESLRLKKPEQLAKPKRGWFKK